MIVCAGLSPAYQQILVFDRVRPGEVNRAREAHRSASGKVLNAVRAVARLGGEACAVTLLGGETGEAMRRWLEAEGIRVSAVESAAPSRICTTVIDLAAGAITELVENAHPVSARELEAFGAAFRREARSAAAAVFMGSLPEGAPPALFRRLIESLDAPAGVPVIADIRGLELLQLLDLRPRVVKPNREELEKTFGERLEGEAALQGAMRRLNERGAEWVVISQGPAAVYATGPLGAFRFQPPAVKELNPIGCGDCLAAGIAQGVVEGRAMPEAIQLGIACAVENAISLLPIDLELEKVRARIDEVRVERWS